MALVLVPILGADFLCMHRLMVDMVNRRPMDALSFATYP